MFDDFGDLEGFAYSAATEGVDAGRDKGSASVYRACESCVRVCVVEARFMFEHFQGHSVHKIVLCTVVQKPWRSVAKAQTLCFASSRG